MVSRDGWTRRALVGIWTMALAAVAATSCLGPEPTLPCAEGGDAGENGRLLCPDPDGTGASPLCVDPAVDSRNCGTCGTVCGAGQYCSASTCAYPTSCADLLKHVDRALDGAYVIQPAGLAAFTVHCADMSTTTPREYLTLLHTYGNGATLSNVSTFDCVNCTDIAYTYFEKVRIDPATLAVDVTDTSFATMVTSDPTCWASIGGACEYGRSNTFAKAGNCLGNGMTNPGNVDLRGTPFSIDISVNMALEGWLAYGKAYFNVDRKVLTFSGGGNCGGMDPDKGIFVLKQD